jgi:hypothetical protein
LAFPKAQHFYSVRTKESLDLSIALFVSRQLLPPVWPVRLRRVAAPWASVPKAAVDKYGNALSRKKEIWAPRHVRRV